MKYRKYIVIAAALVLLAGVSIKSANAYFTDTQEATGYIKLNLGDSEIIPNEDVDGMTKIITVKNTGNYNVFVRVKAIYGSNCTVAIDNSAEGDTKKSEGWSLNDDGYYYYSGVVSVGESAPKLYLTVTPKEGATADSFNVVIVEEATKVLYDSDGKAYADWNSKVQTKSMVSDDSNNTDSLETTTNDTTFTDDETSEGGND